MPRFARSLSVICVCLFALAATGAAQAPGTITESYSRARKLLDRSIETHGGVAGLRAARRIHVRIEGRDVWRNQSRKVEAPYDREPMSGELRLDMAASRMVYDSRSAYPGGFRNALRNIINGQESRFLNFAEGTHYPFPTRTVESQRNILFQLPHLVLLAMLDNAAGLRWLGGMTLASGTRVEAITTSSSQGPITVGIDPATAELRALISMQPDAVAGDATTEVEWTGYARQGAILMPGTRMHRVAGEVTQEARYVSTGFAPEFPDSLLQPRPGSIEQTPTQQTGETRELGPGAWAIRARGSWILAVAFNDHVLVMETPGGLGDAIARIATLAPGKPIRYAVPTHHHDDHAGGVRYAVNAGATVVTTPGNRGIMARMARARSSLIPGDDTLRAQEPRIEAISGRKRVFTDGTRTVEIHDIGPSPHTEEMLVAWLPAEGVVFQGDLLNLPPSGAVTKSAGNPTTAHFAEWLRRQQWQVRTIAGVHMAPQPVAVLEEAVRMYAAP